MSVAGLSSLGTNSNCDYSVQGHHRSRARFGVSCVGANWGGSPESTSSGEWRFVELMIGDASISIISSSTQRSPEMRVTTKLEVALGADYHLLNASCLGSWVIVQ